MRASQPPRFTRRAALIGAGAAALAPATARAGHQQSLPILAGRRYFSAGLMSWAPLNEPSAGIDRMAGACWGASFPYDRAATINTFRIASISKLFTALGFATLVVEGRIGLDDDIASHLGPAFRHPSWPDRPITPRQLLTHTSGLRNGDDFPVPANENLGARLTAAAREPNFGGWFAPPDTPPDWFSYSDVNACVLAQLIEVLSGQRFDLFMKARVFAAGRLEDIGYNWSHVSQRHRGQAAAGVRWRDGAWRAEVDAAPPQAPRVTFFLPDGPEDFDVRDLSLGSNGCAFSPHGGLRTSLFRLAFWATRFSKERKSDLVADAIDLITAEPGWTYDPQNPNGDTLDGFFQSYGLGPQRLVGVSGPGYGDALFGEQSHEWMGHAGDAYGWITGLWWNLRTKAMLVYAINGVPESGRDPGRRSAFLAAEEELADEALAALSG